jgi:hypothetical protein
MKTLNIYAMIAGMLVFSLQAAGEEFTKKISKSFDVNSNASLNVSNKFGKIHCQNWDKNSVAIEVTITVDASGQEKANKHFDKINIQITGSSDQVTASTNIGDDVFNNNNNSISIDYLISMPANINVNLTNKFGDIIIDEVKGSGIIDLAYGSVNCKRLSGSKNDLEIKFSEGFIGYIQSADMELKYSELEIDEAGDMVLDSQFSQFEVGSIDALTMESAYDDDYIGKVRDIDVEADFSDVEVMALGEKLVAVFDYGELKVKEVDKDFSLIDISNSFSDANIGFHTEAGFRLSATIKMGDLDFPRERSKLSVVDLSFTSSKYEGVVGDKPETISKVLINSSNSGVTLYYR